MEQDDAIEKIKRLSADIKELQCWLTIKGSELKKISSDCCHDDKIDQDEQSKIKVS